MERWLRWIAMVSHIHFDTGGSSSTTQQLAPLYERWGLILHVQSILRKRKTRKVLLKGPIPENTISLHSTKLPPPILFMMAELVWGHFYFNVTFHMWKFEPILPFTYRGLKGTAEKTVCLIPTVREKVESATKN